MAVGEARLEPYAGGYDPEKYRSTEWTGPSCYECGGRLTKEKFRFGKHDYCQSCANDEAGITVIGVDLS